MDWLITTQHLVHTRGGWRNENEKEIGIVKQTHANQMKYKRKTFDANLPIELKNVNMYQPQIHTCVYMCAHF